MHAAERHVTPLYAREIYILYLYRFGKKNFTLSESLIPPLKSQLVDP